MRQVGVPALDTAKPEGEDGSGGLNAIGKGRPRKRGTPTCSRDERNAPGWSSGLLEL
jgi:hypothetical protein